MCIIFCSDLLITLCITSVSATLCTIRKYRLSTVDRTPWLDKETGKAQRPGRSKYSSLQVTTGTTSKDVLGGCLIMRRPFLPTSSEQASRHEDTRTGMGLASQTDRQTGSAAEDSMGSSSSYWAETCEVGRGGGVSKS